MGIAGLSGTLHNLRVLGMEEVPAQGLSPSHKHLSQAVHRVSVLYASAVPINSYQNVTKSKTQVRFQTEIGRLNLIAQYYGAMKLALQRSIMRPAQVFLMPLGGGVFNNPMDIIIGAMSLAIELLHGEGVDVVNDVNIHVLGWEGNPWESYDLSVGLEKYGKLKEGYLKPPSL